MAWIDQQDKTCIEWRKSKVAEHTFACTGIRLLITVGFMKGKPYTMEGQNGMNFMTDQYAIVAHGKAVKEWPFVACSDSKITEVLWLRHMPPYLLTPLGRIRKIPTNSQN